MCTAGPGTAGDASQATKFELKSQRAECLNILRYTYGKGASVDAHALPVFLLMSVLSKTLLTLVRSHLMSFSFLTAWHG